MGRRTAAAAEGHGCSLWRPRLMNRPAKADPQEEAVQDGYYNLRLYVAGQTSKSITALANLKTICEEHLAGRYRILAVPTLVRRLPEPLKKIIGNLSDRERVLVGLDLRPDGAP